MIMKIDLSGRWGFCLDKDKSGKEMGLYNTNFTDFINLPTTVSEAKKGLPTDREETYFLTDPYQFEGYTWYSREVEFKDVLGKELFLVLERTRVSHVWVDDCYVGTDNSLCTFHRYRLTSFIHKPKHKLTVMVDNSSYPVKGGHMTSQDTQTNWNGITGKIYIELLNSVYLSGVKLYPDVETRTVKVKAELLGAKECTASIKATDNNEFSFPTIEQKLYAGENEFLYQLDGTAKLWSEYTPVLYTLQIELFINGKEKDRYSFPFGLRSFKAAGHYFEINGSRTFLRGKHDGLIFPMTGYAPTDLKSWMDVFITAKSYGLNHYRFHTCCPPEAAFIAADMFGVYLEPELPFWGTVTEEGDENHDEAAQQYLIREGFRILDEFGNHPSFVMMSLGNELWGSKNKLKCILGKYKSYDNRHLYTQGSNNFQFVPDILENEDFFCGVRFSRHRLFRGSYAMCDAPQGHVQTMPPDSIHNYDPLIRPGYTSESAEADIDILIQYGTGMKKVKAQAFAELIPELPVVSHEIGQYAMYPDFKEIDKYTGVLKARNFTVFQKRLEQEGMLPWAELFFQASGHLAADCYKAELETALRSRELAGFQILDLQDFTGQGTALVGILNSFLENKGIISEEEWREFCSDTVILAELPGFIYQSGDSINAGIKLVHFRPMPMKKPRIRITITAEAAENGTGLSGNRDTLIAKEIFTSEEYQNGIFDLYEFSTELPETKKPQKLCLDILIVGTDIKNHYDLWLYPEINRTEFKYELSLTDSKKKDGQITVKINENIIVTYSIETACAELAKGRNVLLFPDNLGDSNSIQGTYCTDFWCYPMFRSISESMNKPVPIGTLGLLIDNRHPVFDEFPTRYYTTPQWYDIVTNSRLMKLNGSKIEPLVWGIDNFERNARLGLLYELKAGNGKLMVCTSDLPGLNGSIPATWLLHSILRYIQSDSFRPKLKVSLEELHHLFET